MDLMGIIPPMTTPFRRDGEMDLKLVKPQVDWLIGEGAHGLAAGVGFAVESQTVEVVGLCAGCQEPA